MQTVVGGAVRDGDFPVGVVALHDFHRVRHPVDAAEQFRHFARRRNALQLEGDLGLDARLRKAAQLDRGAVLLRFDHGAVVDRAPHRLVDAVAFPKRAVSESDLAPERLPAAREAMRVQRAPA